MSSIEQACYWLATRNAPECPPLQSNIDVQICVIGAGFTGLWAAYFLKQLDPQLDVVVVEQGCVGYGASGRNAGMVSNCIDHTHALAISHFGKEEAAKLARLGIENIDEMEAFATDCDFERTGVLQVALTEKHIEDCKQIVQVADKLNIPGYKLLSKAEAQEEIHSPLYLGAAIVPGGGILNPMKLVEKIKTESMKLGVRFFERTKVSSIRGGEVQTTGGTIKAGKVILATDAYTHHLFPELLFRFVPLYDYIIVSEPLTPEQQQSIGWKNRQGVVDGRTFFNYYRLTADNRVLWGTSEANYYAPNRVDEGCDHSEHHYQSLSESWKRHFPKLADLKFPFAWGGPIASTTRLTPFFGTLNGGQVLYALGYTGHGIGTTRMAGKILAQLALNKHTELTELAMVKKKPFPYPPEPIRSLAIKAVTHSLRKVDQGEDPNLLLRLLDTLGIGFSS